MEHEVYVPFPIGSVRAALAEPERVARCVPGLQLDAPDEADSAAVAAAESAGDGGAVEGRLRVRIAGSTITYRGVLRLLARENGFAIEGEGAEVRGSGSAVLSLTLLPRAAENTGEGAGTVLACEGTLRAKGRITEFEDRQRAATGRRLLDRFAAALGESLAADSPADDNERVIPGIPAPESPDSSETAPPAPATGEAAPAPHDEPGPGTAPGATPGPDADRTAHPDAPAPDDAPPSAADAVTPAERGPAAGEAEQSGGPQSPRAPEPGPAPEMPPPSEPRAAGPGRAGGEDTTDPDEPYGGVDPLDDEPAVFSVGVPGDDDGDEVPAEAAHARRTMIGRSAEEVDHAPPRGRYAPVPAPDESSTAETLRWAAPAAALAVATAVVVGRVLRRRGR